MRFENPTECLDSPSCPGIDIVAVGYLVRQLASIDCCFRFILLTATPAVNIPMFSQTTGYYPRPVECGDKHQVGVLGGSDRERSAFEDRSLPTKRCVGRRS